MNLNEKLLQSLKSVLDAMDDGSDEPTLVTARAALAHASERVKSETPLAFPVQSPDGQTFKVKTVADRRALMSGMPLRDWFAGKAIDRTLSLTHSQDSCYDFDNAARCAYQVADAMMKARGE